MSLPFPAFRPVPCVRACVHAAKQNPESLLVFAAGNSGGLRDTEYPHCTMNSPALGKNVLAVGASSSGPSRGTATGADGRLMYESYGRTGYSPEGYPWICGSPDLGLPSSSTEPADIDTVAFFSSYGPTKDNRIKPDVVAPGDQVHMHAAWFAAMEFVV